MKSSACISPADMNNTLYKVVNGDANTANKLGASLLCKTSVRYTTTVA